MRIAFFTYPEWAFGAIHNALCKELYKHGIYANIIDWNKQYARQEFDAFNDLYDIFVTVPGNAPPCLNSYGVPNEKIAAIAHGRYDIQAGIRYRNPFHEYKVWGGVSPDLESYAKLMGIARDMVIAKNGIHFDYFYSKPSTSLGVIGYGGALEYKNHLDEGKDLKRGYLIKRIGDGLALPINLVEPRHYLSMPGYYPQVDCVMVSSTEESCGLPLMEAAAAGRLPISTPVGVARDYENAPGIVLPFEEDKFVTEAVQKMDLLAKDDDGFHKLCCEAQEFARANYDWSHRIQDWITLLTS